MIKLTIGDDYEAWFNPYEISAIESTKGKRIGGDHTDPYFTRYQLSTFNLDARLARWEHRMPLAIIHLRMVHGHFTLSVAETPEQVAALVAAALRPITLPDPPKPS